MSFPKPVKRATVIKTITTLSSFIVVLIVAPRMDAPRVIGDIEFTTKTGGYGLTNLGWLLLILVPVSTYLLTSLILKLCANKNA